MKFIFTLQQHKSPKLTGAGKDETMSVGTSALAIQQFDAGHLQEIHNNPKGDLDLLVGKQRSRLHRALSILEKCPPPQ